jgi:hypothetical protein
MSISRRFFMLGAGALITKVIELGTNLGLLPA